MRGREPQPGAISGMRLYLYHEVASTNDVLKEKALAGEPEGSVVLADRQSHGRGRYGRTWLSSPGKGLTFSLLLRPAASGLSPGLLALSASMAIVDTLQGQCRVTARVKWPNDIYIDHAKVAGILVDVLYQNHQLVYAVVGVGINLFYTATELQEFGLSATSLQMHCKKKLDKSQLFEKLIKAMLKGYHLLSRPEQQQRLMDKWCQSCLHIHRPVIAKSHDESLSGIFTGVDVNGAALIELNTGEIAVINSGDYSLQEDTCF